MGFDEDMKTFEAALDKLYPNHIKLNDKVEMWALYLENWELRDTGTVKYVGPGYCMVAFWKNRDLIDEVRLPLNQGSGSIDERHKIHGYKFRGPVRESPIDRNVEEDSY